jgi:hypothetical protein
MTDGISLTWRTKGQSGERAIIEKPKEIVCNIVSDLMLLRVGYLRSHDRRLDSAKRTLGTDN